MDYHFTDKPTMQNQIEQHEFLEFATVHGNLYGTSYRSVQRVIEGNRSCILDVDIQGVQNVMKKQVKATYILIVPPSIEDLSKRLHSRNTDDKQSIQLRLRNSEEELRIARTLPFSHVIVNEDIDKAYSQLKECLVSLLRCFSLLQHSSHGNSVRLLYAVRMRVHIEWYL